MICIKTVRRFCKEPLENIENYDKAISDNEMWHCHHRDEVKVLPSGITVYRYKDELIENGRYYGCPANELIFLSSSDHHKLHISNPVTKERISQTLMGHKGVKHTEESRRKISESLIEQWATGVRR